MLHQLCRTGAIAALLVTAACGQQAKTEEKPAGPQAVVMGPENVVAVKRESISVGPLIAGELRPEREATVRAKAGGSVLQVLVDEAQPVKQGAVLVRIEVRALQDAVRSTESGVRSAESSVRSAEQGLTLAEREAARTKTLVAGGALAERDLETAQNAVTAAEAQVADANARLADARSRLAAAREQLGDTVVRAPISGTVSRREVNGGDVVAPGAPLVTIIDPSSMRLEASVPSDALTQLRIGAPVEFEVRGYPNQPFTGKIDRISPVADQATRQVTIYVSIPNSAGKLVAGLFAEGKVSSETRNALVVPVSAIDFSGANPSVMRIRDGKAERLSVGVGVRDERADRVELLSGVQEGDILLVGAAQSITPGTPVKVAD